MQKACHTHDGTSEKESSSAVMQRETRKIVFKDLRFLDEFLFLKLEFLVPLLQNLNEIFVLSFQMKASFVGLLKQCSTTSVIFIHS